ncbi:MAG TPA: FtsX-like permease family protein [Acidimicrobiales bacterium]|nr:FtsX-like permease family protein [Acidimicrobiales bacterium]
MWRTTLKSLGAHKRRLLATCSAVVLGVAFLAGTLVLGDTMTAGFSDLFAESNAGTAAVVRSATEVGEGDFAERGLVDAALADRIAGLDGVAAAAPLIEGSGRIVGRDGDPLGGNGPPTVAGNWIDGAINPYRLAGGRAPEAPGEVVIDKASAESGDLSVGDTTTIRLPEPVEVTVVGIATFGDADSAGPVTYAAFTTDYARQVLVPDPGKATSIRVAAEPGVSQAAVVSRIETLLPDGVEALTGAQLTAEQEDDIQGDFLGFVENALLLFAGVALVVATFSIYNTFSILVAQRTRESALLRALGASRGQVLRSITAEALLVGVVASAAGLVAGLGLASGLIALMDAIGFGLPTASLVLGTGTVITAMVVGVVVTLVASVAPALRASRIAPLAALREVAVDRSATSWLRALAGAVITALGVAGVVAGTQGDGDLSLTGLGALGTLVGVVMLGPVVARPAAGLLGAPQAAARGLSGTLARRNAMRNPRRTAGTASALMVGVAVVSLFTVVAASIKASIDDTVTSQFGGDLVLSVDDFSMAGVSPEMSAAVAALPQVDAVSALGNAPVRVDGQDLASSTFEPATFERMLDVEVVGGSLRDIRADQVAVSETFADDQDLALGDAVPVDFPDGTTAEATVGAVYAEDDLMGPVMLPEAGYLPHTANPADFVVMVTVADGVAVSDAEAAIQKVSDAWGGPDVQTADEYVDSVAGQVDQVLNVVYLLLVLAIVIALMGIANTLSLSIHERTRELGLLRAVGQSRRQLRSMVRGEALTVALFGTVGGVGLGVFLGWAMVDALADEGFTAFTVPSTSLAVVLVLGALVGITAAVRPARRAARLDVLDAIATD